MGPKVELRLAPAPLQPPPPGSSIFVSNLQWWTTDVELERLASAAAAAPVAGLRFIEDKSCGKSRGMAIVDFPSPAAAQAAIQGLNGVTIDGRPARVTLHQERGPQQGGSASAPGGPGAAHGRGPPANGGAGRGMPMMGAPPHMMGVPPAMMGMPGMMFGGMPPPGMPPPNFPGGRPPPPPGAPGR